MTINSTITGVVANDPIERMTKGDDIRSPSSYLVFGLYELIEGENSQFRQSGRTINVGYFDPEERSLRAGDVVKVRTKTVHSTSWERNGKSGVNYRATTRRHNVAIIRRKPEHPRLL